MAACCIRRRLYLLAVQSRSSDSLEVHAEALWVELLVAEATDQLPQLHRPAVFALQHAFHRMKEIEYFPTAAKLGST